MNGGRALPVMAAWLVHPVTVLAGVVLVVNDHLLKSAYPGPVTGKLSDIAGLVLLPPLLAVIVPAAAVAASTVFSAVNGPSVVLADRSDLAALPALGVAVWVWTRARRRPATRDSLRRFSIVVVLPTAALAVVATPAPQYPDVTEVVSWHDRVVVGVANAYHDEGVVTWLASDRDAKSWNLLVDPERKAFTGERRGLTADAKQACVPQDTAHCYRVVQKHLRVEETVDAGRTWKVSWEVPDDRREYLARSLERVGNKSIRLSSRALAVHAVPGGYVVVVANGRDGCAVRDPSGRWNRVAFDRYGDTGDPPPPLSGRTRVIEREIVLAILAGALAIQIGAWQAASRMRRSLTVYRSERLSPRPTSWCASPGGSC